MLNAVLAGKRGGTGLESSQTQLEQARGAEDVLTASIFERLSYLPDELFARAMSALLGQPFGPLQGMAFWPFWRLPDGTGVEPDVLLEDGQQVLLVEAKRHDWIRQQSAGQLASELLAGWHEQRLGDHCLLLALGGMQDLSTESQQRLLAEVLGLLPAGAGTRFTLICRSWQQLFGALQQVIGADAPSGCQRLLDDIARCYAWHRLRTHSTQWLADMPAASISLHPGAFAHWSRP